MRDFGGIRDRTMWAGMCARHSRTRISWSVCADVLWVIWSALINIWTSADNEVKISLKGQKWHSSCLSLHSFPLFPHSFLWLVDFPSPYCRETVGETEGSDSSASRHTRVPLESSPPQYLMALIIRVCNLCALRSQALIIHMALACISVSESSFFSFAVISSWYSMSQAQKHQFAQSDSGALSIDGCWVFWRAVTVCGFF